MKIFLLLAMALCAHTLDIKMESEADTQKDKRQTQDELVHTQYLYRPSRKQEQVAPVEENQEDDKNVERAESDEYRPGQVFSLNAQELLELQPERKAPVSSNQQLQQLYSNPQPEHKQNLQQFYYLEPQTARQVSLQPSHAVIARPHYSANGGEASVGAALSVSDNGVTPSHSFDQDLLALLGHVSHAGRQEEARQQAYSHAQQAPTVTTQSVAPTYQQVDRYITKPSKKPTKLRSKVQIAPPQLPSAPQQYLIETTNVQQQQQHQPQQQQASHQQQYHAIPQSQRSQIRYVPIQPQVAIQQYEGPESQGLKVVPPPKLQQLQPHPQLAYRFQYQQPEATPKQYRIIEAPRIQQQPHRQEQGHSVAPERPVTYLKRFPEPEKLRAVKIYDEAAPEGLSSVQQQSHAANDQYYIRPVYKTTQQEQQNRYQVQQFARAIDPTKPPLSAIYVSKNVVPKKVLRPLVRVDQAKLEQPHREHAYRIAQPSNIGQASAEQQGQNPEEQRVHLPPPRNNKAYTPEEFAALVAAGYSVTPVPVGPASHQVAQSRSSIEPAPQPLQRRPLYSRRHQYLPLRSDEAP